MVRGSFVKRASPLNRRASGRITAVIPPRFRSNHRRVLGLGRPMALLAAAALAACGIAGPEAVPSPAAPEASAFAPQGEPTSLSPAPSSSPTGCVRQPTTPDAEGPFYKPGAPERSTLVEPGMAGERLVLSGTVMTADCAPVAGVELDFWQTDSAGVYDNAGFRLRGRVSAGADGSYRLETILPGLYPGRPAHIHVKVHTPDGRILTTQIYFEGEAFGSAEAFADPSQLAQLAGAPDGGYSADFDFVVPPPG